MSWLERIGKATRPEGVLMSNDQPRPRPVIRAIARVVIGVMAFNALSPLSVLAQDKGYVSPAAQRQMQQMAQLNQRVEAAKAEQARSPADRIAETLKQAEDLVRGLKADSAARQPAAAAPQAQTRETRAIGPDKRIEVQRSAMRLSDALRAEHRSRLKDQLQTIRDGQGLVRAEFEQTGKDLQSKKLPAEILARHDEAVRQFDQRQAEFERLSAAWQQDPSDANLSPLADFFDRYPAQRRAAPFDPEKLPWGTPKPTTREPATTKTAWFQKLWGSEAIRTAQASNVGPISFQVPPEPGQSPTEADLGQTPETQQTAAIVAQAATLNRNPVAIHNWVRNTIEFVPTWGAIQSAEDTLQKKRGNAHDIASLEISLLRASSIPARYQYGTIEITAEQAQNWVGGVTVPQAAQQLLGQGGIANRGIASGGRIARIQLEHVWVQAYVNWAPSRGARQGTSTQHVNPVGPHNAWVELDASFKQYSYAQGMDLKTQVPLDANALLTAAQQGATVNAAEGWVQNLNQTAIAGFLGDYQTTAKNYIDGQKIDATVGDVLGKKILPVIEPVLIAGSLPYTVVQQGPVVQTVPASEVHKVTLKLYGSQYAMADGSTAARFALPMSALGGEHRLNVTYRAATAADQAIVDQYNAEGRTGLPAYLIRMIGTVYLDARPLGELPTATMGAPQWWSAEFFDPSGSNSTEDDFKTESAVGDEIVFGFNTSATSNEEVAAWRSTHQITTPAQTLQLVSMQYWALQDTIHSYIGRNARVVPVRMPSVGMFAQPLRTIESWGVVRVGYYAGRLMDVRRSLISAVGLDAQNTSRYLRVIGAVDSFLEGATFDVLFNHELGASASAISLLGHASQQGIKLYHVTTQNVDVLNNALTALPYDIRVQLQNAVDAGLEAIVPASPAQYGSWQGVGYVLVDPQTGGGAYLLNGTANGAEEDVCSSDRNNEPTVENSPNADFFWKLFFVLALLAAAAWIIGTGGLGGVVLASTMLLVSGQAAGKRPAMPS